MKTLSSLRIISSAEFRAAILSAIVTLMLTILTLHAWCNPSCFEIPAGLVFRLRADHQQEKLNDTIRLDFQPLHIFGNKLEAGVYSDFIRAQKAKNQLRDKGFKNVELIAYFNHQEISIDDAITLINNRNPAEEIPSQSISVQQMDSLLALHSPADFYYAICIDMKDAATVNTFFNLKEKPETVITPAGKTLYLFGKFSSSEEASVFLELLIKQGLANVCLTAWTSTKEQIPLERAQQLEGQLQAMAKK